ncbi:hypothetical protein JCM10213_007902 [Rhodosporidiobolus nylandii]
MHGNDLPRLWYAHRALCKKDTAACYFPPLCANEGKNLLAAASRPFPGFIKADKVPLPELLRRKGLWNGDYETLVRLLGSPSCHEYSKSSTPALPIPEPTRSRILALCGHFLAMHDLSRSLHFSPWAGLGTLHYTFITHSAHPPAGPSPKNLEDPDFDPFSAFNDVYRSALVSEVFASSMTRQEGRKAVSRAMWEAKTEEICKALLKTPLPRRQAHYLSKCTKASQDAAFAAMQRALRKLGQ